MYKFKLGQKVKGTKIVINFNNLTKNKIENIGTIIDKTNVGDENHYKLDDNNWYNEKNIQLISKYETQKSKLNV